LASPAGVGRAGGRYAPDLGFTWPTGVRFALVVAFLVTMLVWAGTHPLHLRHQTKVNLTTLPIYLLAVLAPPALAGLAAGLGELLAQLRMRPHTGNYPSDIATTVGRWVVIALAASAFTHASAAAAWPLALRLGARPC
jgi:predicted small integral membrane protein